MLVFSKGELVKEVIPLSEDKFQLKLYHPESRVAILTDVSTETNPISNSYFKITRENQDGKFDFFEEIYGKETESIKKFEEATKIFETLILETLKEKPSTPEPPSQPKGETETYTKIPEVGNIVQVENKYGRVVDVDGTKVKMKVLTKEEAFSIMREQRNQQLQIDDDESLMERIMSEIDSGNLEVDEDGKVKMQKGGSLDFEEYDADNVKFTIFEVKAPPSVLPQQDEQEENQEESEPQPDNVIDPFDENKSGSDTPEDSEEEGEGEGESEGEDEGEGEGEDEGEGEGEDEGEGEGKGEGEGEGEDEGEGESEGEGEDKGEEEGEGEDEGEVEKEGEAKRRGKGQGKGKKEKDRDFENTTDKVVNLEELIEDLEKAFAKSKEITDVKILSDIQAIATRLATPKSLIKKQWKSIDNAKLGIGKEDVFDENNKERIEIALNKIFE